MWYKRACGSVDKFGAEIKISFNKLQYHGSCWGGIFTLLMYGIVLFGIVYYGADLVYRQSPQTIYSQENVQNPERYVFKADTFSVSFGIEDSVTWNQIIDPTVYTVTAINRKRFKQFNATSQQYYFQEYILDLMPKRCTLDEFQVSGTQKYYEDLAGVLNMYCFSYPDTSIFNSKDPMDLNQAFIEGDYTSDAFSQIEIGFYSCKNNTAAEIIQLQQQGKEVITCKPQAEIDLHLQSAYIGMYFTNQNFDPNNYGKPFSNAGTDLFWPVSNSLSKYLSVFFKNTYIETDQGLVYKDIAIQKGFQLASNSEQIIVPVDNKFAYINLRFQKGVQDRIFRTYKSVGQVIAEIGGIATFMRIMGYIFAYPISKFQLSNDVINQLFSFKNEQQQNHRQNKKRNTVTFNRVAQSYSCSKGNQQQINNQNTTAKGSRSPKQKSNSQKNGSSPKDSDQFKDPDFNIDEVLIIEKISQSKENSKNKNETIDMNDNSMNNNKYDKDPFYSQPVVSMNYSVNQELQASEYQAKQGGLAIPNVFKNSTPTNFLFNSTSKLALQQREKGKGTKPKQGSPDNQKLNCVENKQQQQEEEGEESNNKKTNLKCTTNTSNYYNQIFKPKSENIHLSFYEYMLYYMFPCTKRIKAKKDKIDFCNQIISEQLDGVYILKKLLELEKLKALLLSDEQLKLFEYIPKPVIDDEVINCHNTQIPSSQNVNKSSKIIIDKQYSPDITTNNGIGNVTAPSLTMQKSKQISSHRYLTGNQFTILKVQTKSEEQKSEEAFQALVQISKKQQLSRKDIKILQMIDPDINPNSYQLIDQTINANLIQKKCESSQIVAGITTEQIELGNLNETDIRMERISKSIPNQNNTQQMKNQKILKLNQVPNSFGIIQDAPEESGFPVDYTSQQNIEVMNNDHFLEFVPDGFVGLPSNIDASAAKLYTSQFKLPLPKFGSFSPITKAVSIINSHDITDIQRNVS